MLKQYLRHISKKFCHKIENTYCFREASTLGTTGVNNFRDSVEIKQQNRLVRNPSVNVTPERSAGKF